MMQKIFLLTDELFSKNQIFSLRTSRICIYSWFQLESGALPGPHLHIQLIYIYIYQYFVVLTQKEDYIYEASDPGAHDCFSIS
jgi:hypothetical protein